MCSEVFEADDGIDSRAFITLTEYLSTRTRRVVLLVVGYDSNDGVRGKTYKNVSQR